LYVILIATISSLALADNQYGLVPTLPGKSCRDTVSTYERNPSCHGKKNGYYVVLTDEPSFVYCDMTLDTL